MIYKYCINSIIIIGNEGCHILVRRESLSILDFELRIGMTLRKLDMLRKRCVAHICYTFNNSPRIFGIQ